MTQHGLITKAHSGFFSVQHENGITVCTAAGRLTKAKHTEDALAVGDRVEFEIVPSEGHANGRVIGVAPRGHTLSRRDPIVNTNENSIRQVIVANVDLVVFVCACAKPQFNARMLDRYLVGAESQQLPILICANKTDLVGDEAARAMFENYTRIGYRVVFTSVKHEQGIAELREHLHGKVSVMTGKSGVGKSSLLNALKPGLAQEVGVISSAIQKGKHTTVVPELFALDTQSWLADTPGLRAYSVWDVDAERLDEFFVELRNYIGKCEFSNCTHTHEPNCGVRAAVEHGEISAKRYDSYCRLREELEREQTW
jgi:ribosome biogenesis GTPase